ncbi:MAG: LamG domain-containing protein, partial [Candidatus Micrarchaeota archaeon]
MKSDTGRAFMVMLSMGLVVPFLFSAIADFTDSSLFNITHRDGFLGDFSNLIIEVMVQNESIPTSYSTIQMVENQWIYVNVSVPEYDYTLSILADEAEELLLEDEDSASLLTLPDIGLELFTMPDEPEGADENGADNGNGKKPKDFGVYINLTNTTVGRTGLVLIFGDNDTIPEVNLSAVRAQSVYNENLVQGAAVAGERVHWKLTATDDIDYERNYTLALPPEAEDVRVTVFDGRDMLSEQTGIRPFASAELEAMTGSAPRAGSAMSYLFLLETLGGNRVLEMDYETPTVLTHGWVSSDTMVAEVSSPVLLSNVTASVPVSSEDVRNKRLRLFRTTNGADERVPFELIDTGGDGVPDQMRWTIPQLLSERYNISFGSISFNVFNSKGQGFQSRIVVDGNGLQQTLGGGESLPESGITNGIYNVTIIPRTAGTDIVEQQAVADIFFENLVIDGSFTGDLRMENVPGSSTPFQSSELGNVYAIDPTALNFTEATVRVPEARGTALYKCAEWDFDAQLCNGEWVKIMSLVPGEEYTFTLTPDDPAFAEANITILNVQSFPIVGGTWIVRFNTTDTANLTIRAVNGTTWDDEDEAGDLLFLELRCGETLLEPLWDDLTKSVIYVDYNCSEVGSETSRVLTHGVHTLEFTFGDDVEYAYNDATDLVISNVVITGFLPTDNLMLSWDAYHAFGDPIINFTTWRKNGNELLELYIPFEGSGNAYSATDYSDLLNNATSKSAGATYSPNGGFDGFGAYDFAGGNDYVSLATTGFPTVGTGNYTLEAWIKTTSSGAYNCIFSINNYDPGFYTTSGNALMVYDSGGFTSSTNASISDGNWHHVAFVREGTGANQLKFYLDGQALGTSTHSASLLAASTLRLGYDGYSGEDFAGTIDEFRFWNIALPAEQIWVHAQENLPSKIVSQMTALGEDWSGCVTPNDAVQDGLKNCSANTTISEGTPLSSCQVISSSGAYQLTTDLEGKNGANPECIWVNASDVILSCQNNNILNNESGTTYGILINSSVTGFSLQNCPDIRNYTYGVRITDSSGHSFSSIGLYNNTYGLYSFNSNDST